jgi:hypothetical protein
MKAESRKQKAESRKQKVRTKQNDASLFVEFSKLPVAEVLRHPESAKRDEGSQNTMLVI